MAPHGTVLGQLLRMVSRHKFEQDARRHLCLAVFPWAKYSKSKGAIKVHVGLDYAGHLSSFVSVTDGKGSDIEVAQTLRLPQGSIIAADRLYQDFGWPKSLDAQAIFLVTRLKRGAGTRFGSVVRRTPAAA